MPILRGSAAATAVLAVSISGAAACDDFDEQLAVTAALEAVKQAQTQAQPAQAATPSANPAEPTNVAAAEAKPAPTEPGSTAATTVRQ
jgi:hypothetical protein